jgi:gamma-glutamylcyclotransferase (GGCT)/AIG2-like uncharacterized protein YtfP/cation transport regulator ChaC
MERNLVFVYGTLRKHERNHFLLKDSKLISEQAWTFGKLFDTGNGYPMMKKSSRQKVYGELYEVNQKQLASLDELEGYQVNSKDNLYEREIRTVFSDNGECSAYLYLSERACPIAISSGDWKIYQLLKKNPEKVLYFAYGSCMDMERFHKAKVGHFFDKVIGVATLKNYSMKYLFTASDGGRGDIIEDGGITEGILYETPFEAVNYLFQREGYSVGMYRATMVDVQINNKIYKDVLTFHVYDKKEEIAPPEHYAIEILRGSRNRVSEEYYKKLVKQLKDLEVPYELGNWE